MSYTCREAFLFPSLPIIDKCKGEVDSLTFFLHIRLLELLAECDAGAFEHLLESAHAAANRIAQGGALE